MVKAPNPAAEASRVAPKSNDSIPYAVGYFEMTS